MTRDEVRSLAAAMQELAHRWRPERKDAHGQERRRERGARQGVHQPERAHRPDPPLQLPHGLYRLHPPRQRDSRRLIDVWPGKTEKPASVSRVFCACRFAFSTATRAWTEKRDKERARVEKGSTAHGELFVLHLAEHEEHDPDAHDKQGKARICASTAWHRSSPRNG